MYVEEYISHLQMALTSKCAYVSKRNEYGPTRKGVHITSGKWLNEPIMKKEINHLLVVNQL